MRSRKSASALSTSEARQVGEWKLAAMDMHAAVLRTTMQCRNRFARIEQAEFVERPLHGEERIAFGAGELDAHRIDFFDAHTVFAGDRAAELDAEFENVRTETVGAFPFARPIRVEQDQRMQIAVARVENIHAAQSILFLHFLDSAQHFAEVLS